MIGLFKALDIKGHSCFIFSCVMKEIGRKELTKNISLKEEFSDFFILSLFVFPDSAHEF